MKLGNACTRNVHTTTCDRPLAEAAREMLKENVGALAVVDSHDGSRRPVGIVTDRDIVCGQLNRAADLHCLTVGDVMTIEPLMLPENSGIAEAIECMSQIGVRRVLVVNDSGNLSGIASIDDLLPIVADGLGVLAKLLRAHSAPGNQRR
jgi:CBS domain-containing protein